MPNDGNWLEQPDRWANEIKSTQQVRDIFRLKKHYKDKYLEHLNEWQETFMVQVAQYG